MARIRKAQLLLQWRNWLLKFWWSRFEQNRETRHTGRKKTHRRQSLKRQSINQIREGIPICHDKELFLGWRYRQTCSKGEDKKEGEVQMADDGRVYLVMGGPTLVAGTWTTAPALEGTKK